MATSRSWPCVVEGSLTTVAAAVRSAVTSSDRWTMEEGSARDFLVLRRPPRWSLMMATNIHVRVSQLGPRRVLVNLSIASPPWVRGDAFQLYLYELRMLADAITAAATAPKVSAEAPVRRLSGREVTLLGLMVLSVAGAVLARATGQWLWLATVAPMIAFAVYCTATKPVPPSLADTAPPRSAESHPS